MLDEEALLSDQERQLLAFFRELSPRARLMLIDYAEKLVSDERALRGEAQKQIPETPQEANADGANPIHEKKRG